MSIVEIAINGPGTLEGLKVSIKEAHGFILGQDVRRRDFMPLLLVSFPNRPAVDAEIMRRRIEASYLRIAS